MSPTPTPTPNEATTLGRVLRIARQAKGLTQIELADRAGTVQSTISSWESGRAEPRLQQLVTLADVLDVDKAAFIDAVTADMNRANHD